MTAPWEDNTVNQPHAETLMVYVCVCVSMYSTKTTLRSCCVWLMHRDTLPIMSEEINIPLSYISTLFISSIALWLTFPTPWLLRLALCAAVEGIMRLCVTLSRFGRSFTTKFGRQRSRDRRGSLLVTLLRKQSSWFHPLTAPACRSLPLYPQ